MPSGKRGFRVEPLILAVETSTSLLGVALVQGRRILWERTVTEQRAHSKMLLPVCASALESSGRRPSDLSAVAVSSGPGSFTGLRIGFATAQGLAAGLGIGIIPVPTFEILLCQCAGAQNVALVHGRARAQTVTALYVSSLGAGPSGDGFAHHYGYVETMPPAARSMDEFLVQLPQHIHGPVHIAGDAAAAFGEYAQAQGRNVISGLELIGVEDHICLPSASVAGLIAVRMLGEGKAVPPGASVPRYYRRSSAEVKAVADGSGFRLEKMTLADLDRVLEIEAKSYQTPWSRRAFTSEITDNSYAYYFALRAGDKIIGYVGMWVILDEAHITNIAVDPAYRRRGLGEMMLVRMFEKAKEHGASRMTLEVRVSNTGAQALYRKLGFADRGLRKGYYTDSNEDAIIMWKDDLGPQKSKEEKVKWMV